ncbi:MAG: P-II family nitrogen regulator, partial [Planctomycetota bacterium]
NSYLYDLLNPEQMARNRLEDAKPISARACDYVLVGHVEQTHRILRQLAGTISRSRQRPNPSCSGFRQECYHSKCWQIRFWIFRLPEAWAGRSDVKMIVAVIQPTKLRALKAALENVGVERITICDSQEFAKSTGRIPIYRGVQYRTAILRKITIEIVVNDDYLERTVATIQEMARTGAYGNDGDGKIFVLPALDAIEFWPEKRGPGAV